MDELGEVDELGLVLALGLLDTEELGDVLAEGERETEELGDNDELGLKEDDGDPLAEELGDREKDGAVTAPGAVPNQSTPGLGPGIPSSYRKMLLALARAFFGSLDWSISVITPRLKSSRVKKSGSGNCFRLRFSIVSGIFYCPHDVPLKSLTFQGLAQLPESFSIFIIFRASSASLRASS